MNVIPGSTVACTPGASVIRGGRVARAERAGDAVALGAGVLSASCVSAGGWSGAASFFGWAVTYAPEPRNVAAATSTAPARSGIARSNAQARRIASGSKL